jgi:hypothetical protein
MFGRRRRAKVVTDRSATFTSASARPTGTHEPLSPDDVYDLVNRRVAETLGPDGRYSLVLRSAADTDAIFSQLASRSLSLAITEAIIGSGLVSDASVGRGAHERSVLSPLAEHTAVAVWADPLRHDPDAIDPAIVSPVTTAAHTVPLRAVAGA